MRIRRAVQRMAATGVLLAAPVALAAPAAAVPPERIPFEDEYSGSFEPWCDVPGLEVDFAGVATGVTMIRDRKGLEFFIEHVRVDETHTGPNGVTTRYTENTSFRDLTVVDNGDTVTVLVLGTGNATLYGPDGKAIARGPGQVRFEIVFDEATGEELSFDVVKGSTGRNDDFCAIETALFGF